MAGVFDVLVYASFLLTPLVGFAVLQLLLSSGLFTAGTEERTVPFFSTTADYFTFKSRPHKWVVMAGFFASWIAALGVYIYFVDRLYFG